MSTAEKRQLEFNQKMHAMIVEQITELAKTKKPVFICEQTLILAEVCTHHAIRLTAPALYDAIKSKPEIKERMISDYIKAIEKQLRERIDACEKKDKDYGIKR